MNRPRLAQLEEAAHLVDLYCKGLKAAGMDKGRCEEENRAKFLVWLEQLRWVPVSTRLLILVVIAALLPMVPLLLFKYPTADLISELFSKLAGL
jgi:hypothetical protein